MLVLSQSSKIVQHKVMEAKTAAANFAVQTGCFCNPGTGFLMLGKVDQKLVSEKMLVHNFHKDYRVFKREYASKGLVRVSVGIPTTFEDVYQLLHFLKTEILAKPEQFEEEVEHFMDTLETPYSFC